MFGFLGPEERENPSQMGRPLQKSGWTVFLWHLVYRPVKQGTKRSQNMCLGLTSLEDNPYFSQKRALKCLGLRKMCYFFFPSLFCSLCSLVLSDFGTILRNTWPRLEPMCSPCTPLSSKASNTESIEYPFKEQPFHSH